MNKHTPVRLFGVIAFAICSWARADLPAGDPNVFVGLSKKIVPSVVNISTYSTIKVPRGGGQGTPDDLFRRFFEDFFRQHQGMGPQGPGDDDDDGGMPPAPPKSPKGPKGQPGKGPKSMSLGTGFIIDASGLILTNNHVVIDADEIKISFTEAVDEKPTDGEVVGRDPEIDVALIRIKSKREMIPLPLGDSDALEVGEYVAAVGNPFGQGHSVTHGIISAKGRLAPDFPLANYLQTDAPINPGNSGGPLVNMKGEVVGINNAIDQRAQGIGFAIPINLVKRILPQLRSSGAVARGYIGVLVNELTPELAEKLGASKDLKAPFVTQAIPGEPADKAGLKPYDIVISMNGKPVHSSLELIGVVTSVAVGTAVPVKVLRNGKEHEFSIKVSQRPGAEQIASAKKEKGKGKKKEKHQPKVELGMTLEDLTPETAKELGLPEKSTGVLVANADYGGPADKAGLIRGDLILEVDRKPVKDSDAFFALVSEKKSYLLRVRRVDPHGREAFSVIVLDLKEN